MQCAFLFLGACHLKAVSVTSKLEATEEWAYKVSIAGIDKF